MADPEIELPPAPQDSMNHAYSPGIQQDEDEKRASVASDLVKLGSQHEIIYHYLTFETELPSPAHLSQPSSNTSSPSQCPNLKKYTSPFLWSARRKSIMTWLSCIATALTAYTAGSYSSGNAQMTELWNVSDTAIAVGVAIFTLGFGVAPMVLAPLS